MNWFVDDRDLRHERMKEYYVENENKISNFASILSLTLKNTTLIKNSLCR